MIKEAVSIDDVILVLNDLLAADPDAAHALVEQRVKCSEKLANHPTIQVHCLDGQKPTVGLLGVINGIFGVDQDGWGPIVAVFEDDGRLVRFQPSQAKR